MMNEEALFHDAAYSDTAGATSESTAGKTGKTSRKSVDDEKILLNWDVENYYFEQGYSIVCGIDEAGRGPLAGPVVAAACILPPGLCIPGLTDSKKLSEKKREKLYEIITESALAYGIGEASPEEIDEFNILNATFLAMNRAVSIVCKKMHPDILLVDGDKVRNFDIEAVPIIKGDGKSPSIAAASVLAKVTRDRMCIELDKEYPEYGFAVHKGYPTKAHKTAVCVYGPSPVHRISFLRFVQREREKLLAEYEADRVNKE